MKHSIMYRLVLMISLCMGGSALFAQEAKSITLQEAIDLSIKNSGQLKNSDAKIVEATAALKEAVERRLPDASIGGSYLRLNKPNVNMQSKTGNTGGGTGGGTTETAKPTQAAYVMGNLSLPIYTGGRIKYGIESAKYLEQAAKLDAENDKEEIVLNTIDAFNNLYKSKAAVDLVKENLQTAQQRVKDLSNLEKNGLLPRNDLLKAQLQTSNTELALLDAENNWKLANVNMNLMLGLPQNTIITPDSASLQQAVNLKGIEEYVQLGLQHRKDLSALSLRKQAASVGVKATEGEKYPSIALTGGYFAVDVPKVLTVTNAVNIGIGVQYNIASLWKNGAKVQQAKARERQVAATEGILTDAVRLQINQSYQNYLLSRKKIDVYANAVEQANENYRIVKNKFDNSLATTTDLLDADVAQLQAKMNFAFAKSDAVVAYNKLLQTAGLLTEQDNK